MKTMNLTEAKDRFSEVVAISQGEKVLVLKHGKPVALIQGVEGYEIGELFTYADLEFWQWAARRQREAEDRTELMSASEVRDELLAGRNLKRGERPNRRTTRRRKRAGKKRGS